MKLIYIGAHDAVDVPLYGPVAGLLHAKRDGEPIDVPNELGKSLLEQASNWKLADKPAPKPAAAAAEGKG